MHRLALCAAIVLHFCAVRGGSGLSPEEAVKRMKLPEGFSARCVASRADDPPAGEHQLRCAGPDVGAAVSAVPELRGPEAGQAGSVPADDLGQRARAAAARAEGARPAHDPLRPGRERRLPQVEGLRHRAQYRERVLPRPRRRVRRAAAVPALLPGQEPRRRAGRRPRSAAHRLRDGRHALAGELAAVGPGRLALRRGRQHEHLQIKNPAEPERASIEFQQGIWRYHPKTKVFELFSEGGGNTYGLDFDKHGQLIAGTNWGGFAMLHQMQGAYYVKGFASTARCTTRTPTATSTTCRTRGSRAATSPAAASSTRPTLTRRSSATSTSRRTCCRTRFTGTNSSR